MRAINTYSEELGVMIQFIEHRGTTADEDFEQEVESYRELVDRINETIPIIEFIALQIFLTFVIYHLISKMRGNEKNVKMNNFGIALSLLGLWCSVVEFIDFAEISVNSDK